MNFSWSTNAECSQRSLDASSLSSMLVLWLNPKQAETTVGGQTCRKHLHRPRFSPQTRSWYIIYSLMSYWRFWLLLAGLKKTFKTTTTPSSPPFPVQSGLQVQVQSNSLQANDAKVLQRVCPPSRKAVRDTGLFFDWVFLFSLTSPPSLSPV